MPTLAIFYLVVPAAILLASAFSGPFLAGLAFAGFASFVLIEVRRLKLGLSAPSHQELWTVCIISAGAVWFTGQLPPFTQNSDWIKHLALLNLLADQAWPPVFETPEGKRATVRYSLAWYVIPGLAGKIFGHIGTVITAFLWTVTGLALTLWLAFGGRERGWRLVAASVVFLSFSGLDIVGYWITGVQIGPRYHYEWWAIFGQLSSSATVLTWTPQHAISGWIGAMLFLRHPELALRHGGVLAAAIACWSPFSVIGLAPVVIYALMTSGLRPVLSASNLIAAPLLLVPAWIFITQDAAGLPYGFVWQSSAFTVERFALFIALEIVLIVVAVIFAAPRYFAPILLCALFLIGLSLVTFGLTNDLLMRGGIPALAVIAVLAAEAVLVPTWRVLPLAVCLLLGAATPAGELLRAFKTHRIGNAATIGMDDVLRGIQPDAWRQYGVSTGN